MNNQQSIHYGITVTNEAIQRAEDHANEVHPKWSETAYEFLKEFIKTNRSFQCEDVRYASQGVVPVPPSATAWGGIMRKARKAGLIKHHEYKPVKNVNAHQARASVWHTI